MHLAAQNFANTMRTNLPLSRGTHFFPLLALLLYTAASACLNWHHEPWRDEMQCWEIARQSQALSELFVNARYEGHPSAWYLLLYLFTRFSQDFELVRLLHWGISLASVAVVLWCSPFGRWQKALLVFGYFFLFEYGVLVRNYALGMLLCLTICSLARDWKRHWAVLHLLLFCLMQCSLFAATLASAFAVPLFFTGIRAGRQGNLAWWKIGAGAALCLAGLLIAATDMAPPADTNFAASWKWDNPDWRTALGGFFRAMLPVPPWDLHGWGGHVLVPKLGWDQRVLVEWTGALVLLVCCLLSLRKSPFALSFFLLAWLAIAVFLAVKYTGFIRHHGHFFVAWVMAFWLKAYFTKTAGPTRWKLPEVFFTLILVVQVASVVPLAYFDVKYPFSQSQAVASFLREHKLESRFLVGDYDYAASPVAFHLRQPIFYPNALKKGTYLLWNKDREVLNTTEIVPVALDLCKKNGPLLLLASYPIPAEKLTPGFRLLQVFAPAMEQSEEYHLYEVTCP